MPAGKFRSPKGTDHVRWEAPNIKNALVHNVANCKQSSTIVESTPQTSLNIQYLQIRSGTEVFSKLMNFRSNNNEFVEDMLVQQVDKNSFDYSISALLTLPSLGLVSNVTEITPLNTLPPLRKVPVSESNFCPCLDRFIKLAESSSSTGP